MKIILAVFVVLMCVLASSAFAAPIKADPLECELCQMLVGMAEKTANQSKAQIEQELLQVCTKLGPFEQICDTFVLMQLPDIIDQIIAKEKPSLVCAQIHMCSNSTMVPKVAAKDTGICNVCQLVVSQVENWVESNETLQNLETQLEQVCTVVPAQYSAICKYVVDSYLPQFIHNVEQSFPPKKCCQIVGLCSDSASKQQQKPKVVAPVPPIPVNNSTLCPLCKATVNFLKPQVENLDVAQVKQQLQFACSFFQVEGCQQIVDKAADILEALKDDDAQTICTKIVDVCPANATAVPQKVSAQLTPYQRFLKAKDEKYCPTCVKIVQYLENLAVSDLTIHELENLADEGCEKLGSFSGLCKKFVPLAIEELKKLLLEKLTPEVVCSTVKMCTKQEIAKLAVQQAQLDLCSSCELVISVADNWLTSNQTEAQVTKVLDLVCDYVPSGLQSQCLALVNQYEQQLVQLFIAEVFNPQTVCRAVGVCQNKNQIKFN
ncbi:hypothetical protein ABK040_001080 [Willaertia magna]